MRYLLPLLLLTVLPVGASAFRPPDPQVFSFSIKDLNHARDRVRHDDPAIQPALKKLLSEADAALQMEPVSVMQKTLVGASGDKHDYFSMGPYWWPDPAQPDGKPYIRKDGLVNPDSKTGTDSEPFLRLYRAVEALALAYHLTSREPYAQQAARLTRVWFLDEATRMNPNLNHGQAIPGKTDGRGIGIIGTHNLVPLTDAIALIERSAAWSPDDRRGFHAWLAAYLDWLLTSPLGLREKSEYNNHGTWYDAQVAQLALVTGRTELAKETLTRALTKRLAKHVEPDGSQPHELARTRPLVYSVFNLRGLATMAYQAEAVGIDWWHYQTADGRSLRGALRFLAPYADPAIPFIKEDVVEPDRSEVRALIVTAASRYDDAIFADSLARARTEEFRAERWNLFDSPPAGN